MPADITIPLVGGVYHRFEHRRHGAVGPVASINMMGTLPSGIVVIEVNQTLNETLFVIHGRPTNMSNEVYPKTVTLRYRDTLGNEKDMEIIFISPVGGERLPLFSRIDVSENPRKTTDGNYRVYTV